MLAHSYLRLDANPNQQKPIWPKLSLAFGLAVLMCLASGSSLLGPVNHRSQPHPQAIATRIVELPPNEEGGNLVHDLLERTFQTLHQHHEDLEHATLGKHGSRGEDRKGGEHNEDPPTKESQTLAFAIMGGVAFIFLILYLLNWPDEDIRNSTQGILCNTVSIFCAVLLYMRIKNCAEYWDQLLISKSWAHLEKLGEFNKFIVLAALLAIMYFFLHIIMHIFAQKGYVKQMKAVSILLAHCAGFAALYFFADMQVIVYKRSKPSHFMFGKPGRSHTFVTCSMLCTIFGAVGLLSGTSYTLQQLRRAHSKALPEHTREEFLEMITEAEMDVLSFCTGYLVVQVVIYLITGVVQEYHPPAAPEAATEIGQTAATKLLSVSIFLMILASVAPFVKRKLNITSNITSMAFAWSLLTYVDWQLYDFKWRFAGGRILACVFAALLISMFSFLFIIPMDKLADWYGGHGFAKDAFRELIMAMGLLIGVSWEKAFDVAIEVIAIKGAEYGMDERRTSNIASIALLVVVLPGWFMFMLPGGAHEPPGEH